ncbi:hypothetical protein DRQ00_03230 [candidate division KSB1 bacterium]|nr:MAG: hypothetical protein DRQ00_03230 [candidate division KSB1 bacterium]RKY87652.1 MAG: hypothetical protein DRQ11_05705 [candidate division KSB1 bacterium]
MQPKYKRILLLSLKIVVSTFLCYFLIKKIGLGNFARQFQTAKISWIIVGLAVFLVSNLLGSLQWYLLMRHSQISITFNKALQYYFIGLFFNNFFVSNMGGDVFRIYYASKYSRNGTGAISSVFLDRFFGFSVLTMMALASALFWLQSVYAKTILPVTAAILGFWILLTAFFLNRHLAQGVQWILQIFLPQNIIQKFREIYVLIRNLRHQKFLVSVVFGTSVLIQFLRVFTHYIAGRSLGIDVGLQVFFVFIPLIALLATLPVSVGGLGVREQTGVILFSKLGVVSGKAASMEFIAYLIAIFSSLPGVIFFLLTKHNRHKYLDQKESNEDKT